MILRISFSSEFGETPAPEEFLGRFAFFALGVAESVAAGILSASEAVRRFFHAENCLYVRKRVRDRIADDIMSRGVQLADLFDALPADEANRELRRELEAIRQLCLTLLEREQIPV